MKYLIYALMLIMLLGISIPGCSNSIPIEEASKIVQREVSSKIIDSKINITVYLPKGYNTGGKYPVLYTLHGASSNEWQWFDDLGSNSCADKLISQKSIKPLIIVSTKTLNSLTLSDSIKSRNQHSNKDLFEEYVCKELVPYIDANFNTIKSNKSRYIGGVSMGGFIALQIALHNPKLFGKAGGHSPASWIVDYSLDSFNRWLFPHDLVNDSKDVNKLVIKKGLGDLKVFLDCGESDFGIVDDTRKLNNAFLGCGIDTSCIINKGDHSNEYWKSNMEEYLKFYSPLYK
jgi:enterochelin esterase-like enzyme